MYSPASKLFGEWSSCDRVRLAYVVARRNVNHLVRNSVVHMEKLTYDHVKYQCAQCGDVFGVALDRINCDCGGVLDLVFDAPALPSSLADRGVGLSRYREALAIDASTLDHASLGTQRTPLLEMESSLFVKCDYVMKGTGERMKPRSRRGVTGALIAVAATALALELVSEEGTFYASHVENPFFLEGTQTWAFELWEQLGDAPTEVVMSVGNGSLFLGAYRGFRYLHRHGLTSRIPRMVAIQAKGWSALTKDLSHGESPPLADGIAITEPRRMAQILKTIEETGGEVRAVDDEAIRHSTSELARRGCWVEPTSGAAWAGARASRLDAKESVVVSLGGAGFKASGN